MNNLPERKLHRLKNYDYSQNGYYFITVCTKNKEKILSEVGNAVLGIPPRLTPIGEIVKNAWEKMSQLDECVKTDEFCIMPNHIHGIIVIENGITEHRGRRSLPTLVAGFKSVTTRNYNIYTGKKESLWQSSYYDVVIRNASQLYETRRYIMENPLKWELDKYY